MGLQVDIRKRLGDFSLDVSFEQDNPAETLALLGASGSGKSMALKCIAGIERPDEGRIALNGRVLFDSAAGIDVPCQLRRVGYLFQHYALFPAMTVEQNVLSGACGGTRAERRERARRQIAAFRLDGLERRRPSQLSGGQQQRCAFARIMANEPELLLLDEPFSALDEYLRWQLELELSDTLRSFPGGVVFVTHNRDEVYRLCDRVCVLTKGKSGRSVPVGELFDAPATVAEATISGCKNIGRARPAGGHELVCEDWGVTLACAREASGCTHVGVRAHFLHVVGAGGGACSPSAPGAGSGVEQDPGAVKNRFSCRVARVIDNVFSTILMCETPGGAQLRVELEKDEWTRLGAPEHVTLQVSPSDVMALRS